MTSSSSSEDEFQCYRLPAGEIEWYEIEPTFTFSFFEPIKKEENRKKIRSTSAYALFFRERQALEKRMAPYSSFGQISQRIARQWDLLSENEKKTYKQKCEKNRKKSIANAVEEKARQLLMSAKFN